jgi:hypothetical protein
MRDDLLQAQASIDRAVAQFPSVAGQRSTLAVALKIRSVAVGFLARIRLIVTERDRCK